MARIRSIKPDFFTSEVIATLPISARLTFIGLWTHVDDNGVCLDNERLISAAIWPLEDDPREALQRLQEDLRRLHEALLITRYSAGGKRYLFITNWDEHQKVSHPRIPRFPRPAEDGQAPLSSGNNGPPPADSRSSGGFPEDRRSTPETLRPEQGAGSREQGAGSGGGGPAGTNGRHPNEPPSPRCIRHKDTPDPPPCRPCGDARQRRERWDVEETARTKATLEGRRATERQDRIATERAAIDACTLCGPDGRINGGPCRHDPDLPARSGRGRALADAELAKTAAKGAA